MDTMQGIVAVISVVFIFGIPMIVAALGLYYKWRKEKMLHQTMIHLLEKGIPIPPELLQAPMRRKISDLRTGLILVGTGLGLTLFFLSMSGDLWGVGFIPLLIGVGYLIAWKLETKSPQDSA